RLFDFVPHLTSLIAASDVVVTMAGYNTVTEILALGRRAVLVPRIAPRREQWIRARLLSRHGLVHMLAPDRATPQRLAETVERSLARHALRPSADLVAFEGAEPAVAAIRALLSSDEAQSLQTAGKSR